jgi:hypothetical protein
LSRIESILGRIEPPSDQNLNNGRGRSVDHEDLIDIQGLAKMRDVSYSTAAKYAREGLFPALRIGRTYRFSPRAILAQVNAPRDIWAKPLRSKPRRLS